MKYYALGIVLLLSTVANAQYKIAIYTDQPGGAKARSVVNYLQSTPPLSNFDIQFDIVQKSTGYLNCGPKLGISRLIACDDRKLSRDSSNEGYDQVFVVSNYNRYGGSGGSIPVITAHSTVPDSMMLHEYMHTIGFADEYEYSASEAAIYCEEDEISRWLNTAIIDPNPSGYSGDAHARSEHSAEIPWYSRIQSITPIATTSLGTPSGLANHVGLFRSHTCDQASPRINLWKPNGTEDIMESLNAPVGGLGPMLTETLLSLGMELKDPDSQETDDSGDTISESDNSPGKVIILDPQLDGDLIGSDLVIRDDSSNNSSVKIETVNPDNVFIKVEADEVVEQDDSSPEGDEAPKDEEIVSEEITTDDKQDGPVASDEVSESDKESVGHTHPNDESHTSSTTETIANSNEPQPNCSAKIQEFFNSPANRELKDEYMKLQGKITLHRVAWTFLKQADSPTDSIEDLIEEMIIKRDPTLHHEFLTSKTKSRNERLGFAINDLKSLSQALVEGVEDQAYALQYSDVKMMNLLVNAEELNGRGMRTGVMDFTSIIKNSLKNRFSKKDSDLAKFKATIDYLTGKKKAIESQLQSYLAEVGCDKVYNSNTCVATNVTTDDLSKVLQESESLIDFVYKDDFGKKQELKNVYQWRNYWLHVGR